MVNFSQVKPIISIENIVASVSVGQRFDLVDIVKRFPNASYDPKKFPGLALKLASAKATTLIFSTGKMICAGTKSEKHAIIAVGIVIDSLKKAGIKIKSKPVIEIKNIVASINLGRRIHLELAAKNLPRSIYEPEQFSALVHRMIDPKSTMLIFASGKLISAGTKKETELFRSVNNLRAMLEEKNLLVN